MLDSKGSYSGSHSSLRSHGSKGNSCKIIFKQPFPHLSLVSKEDDSLFQNHGLVTCDRAKFPSRMTTEETATANQFGFLSHSSSSVSLKIIVCVKGSHLD
jgi:hypothetical protein